MGGWIYSKPIAKEINFAICIQASSSLSKVAACSPMIGPQKSRGEPLCVSHLSSATLVIWICVWQALASVWYTELMRRLITDYLLAQLSKLGSKAQRLFLQRSAHDFPAILFDEMALTNDERLAYQEWILVCAVSISTHLLVRDSELKMWLTIVRPVVQTYPIELLAWRPVCYGFGAPADKNGIPCIDWFRLLLCICILNWLK